MTLARRRWIAAGGGTASYGPYPAVSAWTISRAAGNPLITIPSGETLEQYVPAPVRLPNGDIWVYVKGSSRIYAWKSTDGGASFTIGNGGAAVLLPGAVGTWDHDFAIEPTALYDQPTDTIHLWYKGNPGVGGTGMSWGHASAASATPTTFTKDPANPILGGQDVAVHLGGGAVPDMAISWVIKIGSSFYFYGYIKYAGTYYLCYTTGTALNVPSVAAFTLIPRFGSDVLYETPSVIGVPDGSYLMLYASGVVDHSGSRSIFTATSPEGTMWTAQSGTVLAPTGSGWEQNQVYSGQFIRSNYAPYTSPYVDPSGRWLYFYSGDNGSLTDQAGLAYITP